MFAIVKSLKLPLIVLSMCFLAITVHDWFKADDRLTVLLRDTPFVTAAIDFLVSEPELELPAESFGKTIFDTPQGSGFAADVLIDKTAGRAFEPLINYSEEFPWRVNGKSVGRLDVFWEGENGKELRRPNKPCTAFFVDTDKLMTAGHCVQKDSKNDRHKILRMKLVLNYHGSGGLEDSYVLDVKPEPLEYEFSRNDNDTIDYALLQIAPESLNKILEADRPKPLNFVADGSDKLTEKQRLYVLHHPKANPLKLTNYSCRTADKRAVRKRRIAHVCDTLPGSSGAPIFAVPGDYVVGVHTSGDDKLVNDDAPNFGQHVAGLAELSQEKAGEVFKLIDPKPFLTQELLRLEKYVHRWALSAYENKNYALAEILAVAGFKDRASNQNDFPATAKKAESLLLRAVSGNAEVGFLNDTLKAEILAYSKERSELAIGTDDGLIKVFDLPLQPNQSPKTEFNVRFRVTALTYSQNGIHLAVGTSNGLVLLYNLKKFSETRPTNGFDTGGKQAIKAIAFTKNNHMAVAWSPVARAKNRKGFVHIYDLASPPNTEPIEVIKTNSYIFSVDYSSYNSHLALGLGSGKTQIYDLSEATSSKLVKTYDTISTVFSIKYSPYDGRLATGSRDGKVRVYDPSSDANKPDYILNGEDGDWVTSIDFSHNKNQLAMASRNGNIQVFDLDKSTNTQDRVPVKTFATRSRLIKIVFVNSQDNRLAIVMNDNTVRMIDTSSSFGPKPTQYFDKFKPINIIYGETFDSPPESGDIWSRTEASVTSLAFVDSKNYLVAGYRDGNIRVYDLQQIYLKDPKFTIDAKNWINSVSYSPINKHLAVGTANGEASTVEVNDSNGTIHIYDFSNFNVKKPKHIFQTKSQVIQVAYSPDGTQLVAGCRDGSILIFDIENDYEHSLKKPGNATKSILSIVYLDQNQTIAVGSQDRNIRIYDTLESEQTEPNRILTHEGSTDWDWVVSLSYSPTRKLLAASYLDDSVRFFDFSNETHNNPVTEYNLGGAISFSPDGNRLASSGVGSHISDISISYDAHLMQSFEASSRVFTVAFSPDGEHLATGTENGDINIYQTPKLRGGALLRRAQERLKASGRLSDEGDLRLTRDECQKFQEFCNSLN